MKFWASTSFSPPEHYVPLARAADDAGIDGLLMSDHIFYPKDLTTPYPYSKDGTPIWPPDTPWPDNWVMIGAMAAVTTRIQFGTAVYIAPARDLFSVAKQVGTAAVVSENRVNLGVGAGWMREEFAQTGQEYTNRGKRLDEMIPALRELWRGGWVEHHGEYYDFGPLQIEPAPSASVPIWVGGHSEPALRRAATFADGWIGNAYAFDEAERRIGDLRRHLEGAGRADEPFEIIIGLYEPPTPAVVERAAALGVTGLMCVPWFAAPRDDDSGVAGANRGTDLDRKIEATYAFADSVIKPLIGL
jgi:probable F420-dependent oxidoreductase